jgi:hypothetical protein
MPVAACVVIGMLLAPGLFDVSNSSAISAVQEKTVRKTGVSDPRADMIGALQAASPHPSLGSNARLFDRFVGTWDFDCVFWAADGAVTRFPGEWIFGWILDGRAIQDVWIGHPEGARPGERDMGTTLRFYDAETEQWRVMFVVPGPTSAKILILRGVAEGDRIVLTGDDIDGSLLRWSFNEIQANSFLWRGETSADRGKTWRIEQEMRLRRRIPTPSTDK